ncbi:MAG: hypothetical protein H0X69_09775 [Gemmatimonadales bacterium]|nr:hypothetical protein [Gemmatimonadales bacterium]
MLFSRCQRVLTGAALVALALCATASTAVAAKPKPGRPGFRLFASAVNVFTVNRVQCRVFSTGQICATGSSTVGGGIWPRGTADQYVFGSGINIAGVIEPGDRSVNGFAGDTAGGFFNNTAGGDNSEEVRPIFDSNDAADAAVWPDEARVPCSVGSTSPLCVELGLGGDAQGDFFDPALQGSIAASQGDLWFLNWEGNPTRLESRSHPMGVAVETRALGWNFPQGNEDVIYFLYTFYNISSTNEADYAAVRPALRPILLEQARTFQATNTARFGINLPAGGYAINDLFAAFVADMDVAQADANYAAVNVPFALGVTYENTFSDCASLGCSFPPEIFGSAPFFPGIGFVGVKYLGSPNDPETGEPVGLTLFSTFSRSSGSLQDPSDEKQLYRYITGGLLPTDGACSLPNPLESKICFVNISSPADMRFLQSSGPIDLPPGGFGTIVVAYIFAAPVASGGCPGAGCDVKPANSNADLTILGNPQRMANGVNKLDTMMGYLGFSNGGPNDTDPTTVTQDEFLTVPGSLLRKAQTAQSVFDNQFLLPFAPERPEFFLVPGNNQVTVLWARSPTETSPDPFFAVAGQPLIDGVANPLYDPNFRGFDVEGYRLYRGRTDNPSELQLVAQFDYAPDETGRGTFTDFRGLVNPEPGCAPEIGVFTLCDPALQPPPAPGTPFTGSTGIDLTGTITQVTPGNRVLLASGEAQLLPGVLDTAFTDVSQGRVAQGASFELANTGVPFLFIDRNVRNSLRYFYAVTAFDVNSLVSGPSSLESARVTKAVIPVPAPSNQQIASNLVTHTVGRDNIAMDTVISDYPSFDGATARFGGPFPPADGGVVGFVGEFAASIIQPSQSGALTMTLDSLEMGNYGGIGSVFGLVSGQLIPTLYHVTLGNGVETFRATISHQQDLYAGGGAVGATSTGTEESSAFFEALVVDQATANRFEGSGDFRLQGQATVVTGPGQEAGGWGVASRFEDMGAGPATKYNGSRWFDGPSPANNETVPNPQLNNCTANAGGSTALLTAADCGGQEIFDNVNNAGALTGVTTIQQAMSYIHLNGAWRNFDWLYPTVRRAADFNVYWGDAGVVDSVIDVTHNVVVPFQTYQGAGWGILNTSAGAAAAPDTRPTVLTVADVGCVEPFVTGRVAVEAQQRLICSGAAVPFGNTAELGAVAFVRNLPDAATAAPAADGGFLFYIAGDVFLMSMPALPAAGTVWALRAYHGTIIGAPGAYTFTPPTVRPFTAIGATASLEFGVSSVVAAATRNDLTRVHTVPDPYYVMSAYEASTEQKVLKFVGLPQRAIIRIYSVSGVLVRMLEHDGSRYSSSSRAQGSEFDWDLRNRNNQVVASGVYFYHVEAGDARRVGRFTVVNFAQ